MSHHRMLIGALILMASGCQQEMANQPSYRPLVPSRLFPNGMSARQLPRGVVAREWKASNDPLKNGLKSQFRDELTVSAEDAKTTEAKPPSGAPTEPSHFVDTFPFAITRADLERGQERYTIYCALCHDSVGTGRGKIVERGYVKPPNFHTDASRGFARYDKSVPLTTAPIGYIFEVITRGYGAMPRYGPQISEADRWRIIAYLRALQLSQYAVIDDLPVGPRKAARDALGERP
jgi:mono/diheme cytochrome c family protein